MTQKAYKYFEVREGMMTVLVNYLATKPYKEVTQLIAQLGACDGPYIKDTDAKPVDKKVKPDGK